MNKIWSIQVCAKSIQFRVISKIIISMMIIKICLQILRVRNCNKYVQNNKVLIKTIINQGIIQPIKNNKKNTFIKGFIAVK
jgi:hypothetical protein